MENLLNISFEGLQSVSENNTIEDIVLVSITGSSLFKENSKDLDLVVAVKNFEKRRARAYKIIEGKIYDIFIIDKDVFEQATKFKDLIYEAPFFSVGYYVCNVVFGDYWFEYNISDYQHEAKKLMSRFLVNTFFKKENFETLNYAELQRKKLWWQYLQLKFIENQEYVVTEGDKQKMERWYAGNITEEDINFWKEFLKENKDIEPYVSIFVSNNLLGDTLN
jgi:hypothetical protein